MDEENRIRCVSAIAKRCIGNHSDWISALSEREFLTSEIRSELRKLKKEKNFDELFRLSCRCIYQTEHREDKISELFRDEDFQFDQRVADVMNLLFSKADISDRLTWIIDSWNILESSSAMKDKASELTTGIFKEDWLLDFILHLLLTNNSYVVDFFVSEAKKYVKDQQHSDGLSTEGSGEAMEIDDGLIEPTTEVQESFVGVSMCASTFERLNSDGEESQNDPQISNNGSSVHSSPEVARTSPPPPQTTEEFLQQVEPFQTESSGEHESWEMLDPPIGRSKETAAVKDLNKGKNVEDSNHESESEVTDNNQLPMEEAHDCGNVSQAMPSKVNTELDQAVTASEMPLSIGLPAPTPKAWSSIEQASPDHAVSSQPPDECLHSQQENQPELARMQALDHSHSGSEESGAGKGVKEDETLTGDENKSESRNGSNQQPTDKRHDHEDMPSTITPKVKQESQDDDFASQHLSNQEIDGQQGIQMDTAETKEQDKRDSLDTEDKSPDENISPQQLVTQTRVGEIKPVSDEGTDTKPKRLSSSSSSESLEEDGSLDWFSSSIAKLERYKYNVQAIVKLAWPKKEKLMEESNWPIPLITFLEELSQNDENFVKLFITVCNQVFQKTEPMKEKWSDDAEDTGSCLRKNVELLQSHKEEMMLLYQLTWPSEKLGSDDDANAVVKMLLEKNKKKKRKKLKEYLGIAKWFMGRCAEGLPTLKSSRHKTSVKLDQDKLQSYKYNIQALVKLTWPTKTDLLEESEWPSNLMLFLEELAQSDESLMKLFMTACDQVFLKSKPMPEKWKDDGEAPATWLHRNEVLLQRHKEDVVLLYQLTWPSEKLSDVDAKAVKEALLDKSKNSKQKTRLKEHLGVAKWLLMHQRSEGLSTSTPSSERTTKTSFTEVQLRKTVTQQPQKQLPDENLENENSKKKNAGGGAVKKMKDILGIGKERTIASRQKRESVSGGNGKHNIQAKANTDVTTSQESKSGKTGSKSENVPNAKADLEGAKKYPQPLKELRIPTSTSPKANTAYAVGKTSRQSSPRDDKNEEFYDAMENLEDCVILTIPEETDHSFEIRAVYTETDPRMATLYIIENCWHEWQPIKMKFNRERNFYHLFLPLPDHDFKFQYKYVLRVDGHPSYRYYEWLPSYHEIVNRETLLTKELKYIQDVPMFHCFERTERMTEAIARLVHFHLPPVASSISKSDSYTSFKTEISSWVNQTERGWRTTNYLYHTMHLSPEMIDIAVMRWMIQYLADGNETFVTNRILVVLNMVVALHKVKHRIKETKLVDIICAGLSVHKLDLTQQKKLYQLIKKEFSTTETGGCPIVREALIGLYQQLRVLISSSSPWMEWILSLPLYWIVANGGEIRKTVSPNKKGGSLLFARSALPEANQLSWSEVRARCKSDACQRALMDLSKDIFKLSEIHPWIVGSFLYMLQEQSLLKLLKNANNHAIVLKFPIDTIFSLIVKEWKPGIAKREALEDASSIIKFFESAFEDILTKKVESYPEDIRLQQKETAENMLKLILKITADFEKYDSYKGEKYSNYVFVVKMTNCVSDWILQLVNEENYDGTRADISGIFSVISAKIPKFHQMGHNEIQFLDNLLRISWRDEQLQNSWLKQVKDKAKALIIKEWGHKKEDFLEFYIQSAEKHKMGKHLEECIEDYAVKCAEHLFNNLKSSKRRFGSSWWSAPRFPKLFGKLFIKEYEQYYKENTETPVRVGPKCLQFVTNWKFISQFYQEFYIDENRVDMLMDEVRRNAGIVARDFRSEIHKFCTGMMKISEVEYVVENREAILAFYSILLQKTKEDGSIDDKIATCLPLRKQQLEAIKASRRNLKTFISLCATLENADIVVDVEELENLHLMKDKPISTIIEPNKKPINPERGLEGILGESRNDIDELHIINSIHESHTFEKVWSNVMDSEEETQEKKIGWKQVLYDIWPSAKKRTFSVFGDICNGSIPVSILAGLFDFSSGDKTLISNELNCLAAGGLEIDGENMDKTIQERASQIRNLLQLKKSEKASHLILNLKEVLNLSGDFQCLELIQSIEENEDVALKDVNLNVDDSLSDQMWSDTDFLGLLERFVQQDDLITWLKKEMKDLKEVQTFCDLGMISAGENPYEVDRVSYLLRAVMGFSPFIFDLNQSAGFRDVMDKCRVVKHNADSDNKLIDKWTDTARQLSWFEGIHNLHGSVGTQSLTLAQDINCRGIYLIQKPDGKLPAVENSLQLVLQLNMHQDELQELEIEKEITEQEAAPPREKRISYNGLKDLQSKLMLIAGEAEQGHQEVARFNYVLSAVANLTQGYINLVNAGCMLFNDWSGRIVCSKEELLIDLSFSDEVPRISTTASLKDLELLVGVMNESLIQWNDYIDKMRLKHYYLNDYNIQQIMYLCEKLAKSDFTDQVYSLLSGLRRQQVCDHMQNALDEATEIQDDEEIVVDESPLHDGDDESQLELKKRMVRELAKNGLSETVAKAAVQCEGNRDVEDCENWALLNQYDEDIIARLSDEFDEEAGFGPETNIAQNYASLLHNRTSLTLKDLITRIQEETERTNSELKIHSIVKTICGSYNDKTSKLTLQDSLSINHFGKFLTILREKLGVDSGRVNRILQAPMQQGKANLVLIPTGDMLYTTLSLYMQNKDQSLPSKSEVLVCTENTSEDEVGRFLRRAMCHNPRREKRLFCMVFADKLTFSVSSYMEKFHSDLLSKDSFDHNYQMVIFCSNANQQHYLVTCFDRTKVELKLATEREKLSKYLFDKLKAKNTGEATVKLVSSKRSGVGKSLYVHRLAQKLEGDTHVSTVRLLEKKINIDHVLKRLYREKNVVNEDDHLVHFDLTSAVESGIEEFSFNLFVLGSMQDSHGQIWRRHFQHTYVVEMVESKMLSGSSILNLIPSTKCLGPMEVLEKYKKNTGEMNQVLMDEQEFESDTFQRPYQYLKKYDANSDLDKFHYTKPDGDERECIEVLLKHCGMKNPSWAQLKYFSRFLNIQLINCEQSIFCKTIEGSGGRQDAIQFAGLKAFAVFFMIKMAQDFATPSLQISDESARDEIDALEQYEIRRRWEDEVHPFVFFNEDRMTMTFINVNIDDNGDLLHSDGRISRAGFISKRLLIDLKRQGVPFGVKFNTLSREDKIQILCQFMNIPREFDPDKTYELTTDNVLKMLAIYMRLRCEIPVIVMGETGCGKTRMIEFMSKLRGGQKENVRNMVTLKIHGGINVGDIYQSVREAKTIAELNTRESGLNTVLFYDEANTTSAIYAIKEVVCDFSIDGEDFRNSQLQIVAACNPYKQLSDAAVKRLEESGLGYNIKASEAEQVGRIPMRRLVYRVVPLPPSMQPFVWDFGQLGDEAEDIYIKQMTSHLKEELGLAEADARLLHSVLFNAQCYMRQECKDESRYVSLRDVERSLKAFKWFHEHAGHIFPEILDQLKDQQRENLHDMKKVVRCLLHTISICYHASLDDRKSFRQRISKVLNQHLINLSEEDINNEIIACQMAFTDSLKMDDNIACNEALRENVFLMTVCTDLRIPLFVVGKPGSSKSLAKTIVGDNMQGKTSHCDLYKHFKQVHILSYQCSALTDAEGIESIFNQCAQLQSNQDISSYTAVVVLDEIGLAEDSPNMPLKVLHPLLECGSTKNGTLTEFDPKRKVAFVGISNWALDPAKMNRGIFVTRASPSEKDLEMTAEGIFEFQKNKMRAYRKKIKALTDGYLKLYDEQKKEYFGLRDYYSLIKMLHETLKESGEIKESDVENALQRNFSGGVQDCLDTFKTALGHTEQIKQVSVQQMVQQNLRDDKSRFLLLLTTQYSAFSLLQNFIPDFHNKVQVIFGSSFPNDHSYTEMCRNINRVKVCMETGQTVILLNMTEINESLYDALNQHYVTLGGQRYVDLGLGGHRVKCRIGDGFRLIVIELKDKVYNEYPIPLINRLEKHHLSSISLLSGKQETLANQLLTWVKEFSSIPGHHFKPAHAFLGFNEDSASSVVISYKRILDRSKNIILKSATMDAVFRLPKSELSGQSTDILRTYIEEQTHDSLCKLIKKRLKDYEAQDRNILVEITTFSNILSDSDRKELECRLDEEAPKIMLLSLQQFQTEQDYLKKLDEFINFCNKETDKGKKNESAVLLVQCPQAYKHTQLIACARYGLKNKLSDLGKSRKKIFIALLLSTERKFTLENNEMDERVLRLQYSPDCEIIYVDELRPSFHSFGQTSDFHRRTIRDVLEIGRNSIRPHEEDDELGIHMPTLLNDCVCEAMAKIKSKAKHDQRNLECVRILCRLFTEDEQINYHFLDVLMSKMVEIYTDRENEIDHPDWVVNEACSAEKLQDGGTFSRTLWLCLKSHVSLLLAYIINLIDSDDNLNIIADTSENSRRVQNMWMEMFKACRVKWDDMRGRKEFETSSKPHQSDKGQLRVPFFFLIHRTLEEQWSALKEEHHDDEKRKKFFNIFSAANPKMHHAIGNALKLPKCMDLVNAFAQNLIKTTYSVNDEAISKLSNALVKIATILLSELRKDEEDPPESFWFLGLFYCMKKYHQHLLAVSSVLKLHPTSIENMDSWTKEMETVNAVTIHKHAIDCALQDSKSKALLIKDSKSCCDWINFVRQLRTTFHRTLSLLDKKKDDKYTQDLLKSWEPLSLLDHLLLHLLPNPKTDEDSFKKYVEIIASHAKLLYKGLSKSGVRGQQILRIVCNVLRKYYEDIHMKVLLSWQNTTCRTCRKVCKQPTILPCGHYFCCSCLGNTFVSSQDQDQKKCPLCSTLLPDDFAPVPTELTDLQTVEVQNFKSHCTSFFLEYLSQFLFSSKNGESQDDVCRLVIDELVLEKESTTSQKAELETIALNLNDATRTSMLSVLFAYDRDMVEAHLNECLLNDSVSAKLAPLIIRNSEQHGLSDEISLEKSFKAVKRLVNLVENSDSTICVKVLNILAGARLGISHFVKTLSEKCDTTDDEVKKAEKESLLYNFKHVILSDRTQTLQRYFVKVGCKLYGMEWFTDTLQKSSCKDLIPDMLKNAGEMNRIDYYTSLGSSYSEMRSSINKTALANLTERVKKWFPQTTVSSTTDTFLQILAISSWLQANHAHKAIFTNHLQSRLPDYAQLCDDLYTLICDSKKWVQESADLSDQQKSVLEQLLPLIAAIVMKQSVMMSELRILTNSPNNVRQLYWPAMPESFFFSMPPELRCEGGMDAMYQCPNGHYYTIGQCTKPWTISRCPDCHAVIGGRSHVAETGNQRVKQMEESSQAGYKLNSTEKNLQYPEDRISMQAASVIQLLIHACMLIGIKRNPSGSSEILRELNTSSPSRFLLQGMLKNLQNLAKSVGRNFDETVLLIHSVMLNILKEEVDSNSQAAKASWQSIATRKEWEKHFRQTFLLPVFQNINNAIHLAQQNLNAAEDMKSIALFRLVNEVREDGQQSQVDDAWWTRSCHWHTIQHSNAAHLMQCIRDSSDSNTGTTILRTILESSDLHLLRYLGDILTLQQRLIENYQNKIDLRDAENQSMAEFLGKGSEFEAGIEKYLQAWHILKHKLQGNGECDKQMSDWFGHDISLKDPMSFILPSARGRGRCPKLLTEHLVEIQNKFLLKCFEIAGINASENEVEAPHISSSQFVQIDKQVDLLPLISLHTSCVITEDGYGRRHHISYNIDALEKQALETFVRNKKLIISESLPKIKYTQDVGIGSDWDKVIAHTKVQEPLTTKLKQTLDDAVAAVTQAEVCEGVRTLTYAISFLAKVETEHCGSLREYLERDLLLTKARTGIIPRFARIHHTLGLYQHLTWHRSVNFAQQGLDPYREALHQVKQENILDGKLLSSIKNAFERMDVECFQQHLNEMLIKVPDYEPEWSLVDDIFPYLLFIGNEETDDTWFGDIPSEVCFKHVSHLFRLSVEHVQNVA